jgi:hypothetical protein
MLFFFQKNGSRDTISPNPFIFKKKSHVAPLLQVCKSIAKVLLVNRYFLANDDRLKFLFHTPSGLVNEVVLDMI